MGGDFAECSHLGRGGPLQASHDGIEPELGGGRDEPFVEPAVMMGGDFAEVGPARHENPAKHDDRSHGPDSDSKRQKDCPRSIQLS